MSSVSAENPVLHHDHQHTSNITTTQRRDDYSSSQDTETDSNQHADNEWYHRRSREIQEGNEERGILTEIYRRPRPALEIEMLREVMEQLEEDMENARINEGTYVERSDALRKMYNHLVIYDEEELV